MNVCSRFLVSVLVFCRFLNWYEFYLSKFLFFTVTFGLIIFLILFCRESKNINLFYSSFSEKSPDQRKLGARFGFCIHVETNYDLVFATSGVLYVILCFGIHTKFLMPYHFLYEHHASPFGFDSD